MLKEGQNIRQEGDNMKKYGTDLSYHNLVSDFNLVKEAGIDFLILREGYRNTIDKKFFEYVKGAIAAGIEIVGVYHFIYGLTEEEVREEARNTIKNLESAGLDKTTIVFSDFEYDSVKKAAEKGVTLGKNECNVFTKAFCEEVQKLGYSSGVYTNLDYYKNWYNIETFDDQFVWLADYSGDADFKCSVHQYTSSGSLPGIKGNVDLDYLYAEDFKMEDKSLKTREKAVELARSWIGRKESDGSHKAIIDIYNSHSSLPRGVRMNYSWAWCACTWSAIAIKLGYTDIMPIEISCGYLINAAKAMGCWVENDDYVPRPGDGVLYDWDDSGKDDNTGWPDHVGIVDYVDISGGYFTVIEGNYSDSVKKRTVSINGKYIRGFIVPKYEEDGIISIPIIENLPITTVAHEVIAGKWGSGEERKRRLTAAGYDYALVQKTVNEILNGDAAVVENPKQSQIQPFEKSVVASCAAKSFSSQIAGFYTTTADLYCRNDAGSNKKALCLIPKGIRVRCYGYYNMSGSTKWYYIRFTLDGVQYTGFSSSNYLKKA